MKSTLTAPMPPIVGGSALALLDEGLEAVDLGIAVDQQHEVVGREQRDRREGGRPPGRVGLQRAS